MIPVDFPERNCIYIADKCLPLPAGQQMDEEFNAVEVISCHELTDEEIVLMLKQIKAGQRPAIYLSVIGGQPPGGYVGERGIRDEILLWRYCCS